MLAGRNALADGNLAAWADEGEKWLIDKFWGRGLEFHTGWNIMERSITLRVFRLEQPKETVSTASFLFEETCKAESFVSETMVAKIMMVM